MRHRHETVREQYTPIRPEDQPDMLYETTATTTENLLHDSRDLYSLIGEANTRYNQTLKAHQESQAILEGVLTAQIVRSLPAHATKVMTTLTRDYHRHPSTGEILPGCDGHNPHYAILAVVDREGQEITVEPFHQAHHHVRRLTGVHSEPNMLLNTETSRWRPSHRV